MDELSARRPQACPVRWRGSPRGGQGLGVSKETETLAQAQALEVWPVQLPDRGHRDLGSRVAPPTPALPPPALVVSTDTQSCRTRRTGCTSTPPTARSPQQQCWTASPSTPKTTSTRPPSWQLTMVCPPPQEAAVSVAFPRPSSVGEGGHWPGPERAAGIQRVTRRG